MYTTQTHSQSAGLNYFVLKCLIGVTTLLLFCEFNGIYLLPEKKKFKRSRWNLWINISTNTDGHYFKMTAGTEIICFYNSPLTAQAFLQNI